MINVRRRFGFTIIELIAVVAIVGLLVAMLAPAVQSARDAARRMQCAGNLRQIGLALANYESVCRVFPFGVGADSDGSETTITSVNSRRFALHTQILPYLDQRAVYDLLNFSVEPFYPDTTGDPQVVTGNGPNESAAQTQIPLLLCPADFDRLGRPWGPNNYRSCNGSSWAGRAGDGMFGQITSIGPKDVRDGLSNTAAFSERIRGEDVQLPIDLHADLFGLPAPWTETTFRNWCDQLTYAQAAAAPIRNSNGGMTWLEGNMNWTRYNHVLTPGRPSCKNDLTWNGAAMTADSRHAGGVNLLLGDGATRFVSEQINPLVWRALASIAGNEAIGTDY